MNTMRNKCKKPGCPAPKGLCLEHGSPDHQKCEHWLGTKTNKGKEEQTSLNAKAHSLPWTGEPFQPSDIELVSQRSSPLIIGLVGTADAAKTSYLGMIYTLLFNGIKFENWSFAGSFTLAAWETLAQYLKIKSNGSVEFPPPTPSNPDFYSLYHLALKRGELFRDVLFADSSGEVFSRWAEDIDDPNATNARWIYEKSNAFILMVDCVALIQKRGSAKSEIVQIAEQIAANLEGRPVAIVWSKADEISNIRPTIKCSLDEDLAQIFGKSPVFEVSNFSMSDRDILCHKNNISVIEYLMKMLNVPNKNKVIPPNCDSDDLFFNYRGRCDSE